MERAKVLLTEEQMLRQRRFEEKIRAIHDGWDHTPRAMVDTFGCQQNVADSQNICQCYREEGLV